MSSFFLFFFLEFKSRQSSLKNPSQNHFKKQRMEENYLMYVRKLILCTCMKNRCLRILSLTCSGNEVYKCTNCSDQARAHFRLLRETRMRYKLVDCHPAEVKRKEKVNPITHSEILA